MYAAAHAYIKGFRIPERHLCSHASEEPMTFALWDHGRMSLTYVFSVHVTVCRSSLRGVDAGMLFLLAFKYEDLKSTLIRGNYLRIGTQDILSLSWSHLLSYRRPLFTNSSWNTLR